jgi:N-acetylmuramoyl-L-alanine amidase
MRRNGGDSGALVDVKQLVAGLFLWCACQSLLLAAPPEVQGMRLWAAPDHTRVVLDTSGPVGYELSTLHNPERLVIDVPLASAGAAVSTQQKGVGLVKGMRAARHSKDAVRIVLDLQRPAKPRSFTLKPGGQYGHRLVIDLYEATPAPQSKAGSAAPAKPGAAAAAKSVPDSAKKPGRSVAAKPGTGTAAKPGTAASAKAAPGDGNKERKSLNREKLPARDLVIAIDAGHGGDDTGAIGRNGTYEKDVVLSIARRLSALVEKTPGMRPVMIRQGDYYIGLRQRINKAREQKADVFISIHADSFRDHRVQGSSVFVLSNRGASSEMARWLAEKENASDLAGGVSLDDKDQLLAEVLLDLSQNATIEASVTVAGNMLGELQRLGKTHKSTVQQAGFVVLKSPDIPSVLVETAFISNPTEERKLRDTRHQEALATAMLRGIRQYFANHPPPGTRMASREHVIQRGDTLGVIAEQYQVSLSTLKDYNALKSDVLRVGQTLRIPPSGG